MRRRQILIGPSLLWTITSLQNQKGEGRGGRGETRTCANSWPAEAGSGANGLKIPRIIQKAFVSDHPLLFYHVVA